MGSVKQVLVRSDMNSPQAACHSHVTGKSLGSFCAHHSERHGFSGLTAPLSLYKDFLAGSPAALPPCFAPLGPVLVAGHRASLLGSPPRRHRAHPWLVSLPPPSNQHAHRAHLACLAGCRTSARTLLGPWPDFCARERQTCKQYVPKTRTDLRVSQA